MILKKIVPFLSPFHHPFFLRRNKGLLPALAGNSVPSKMHQRSDHQEDEEDFSLHYIIESSEPILSCQITGWKISLMDDRVPYHPGDGTPKKTRSPFWN